MKLREAATTKNALRGALKFVDETLGDKAIPQTMRDALSHLRASLKKSWDNMAASDKSAAKVTEAGAPLREQATLATYIEAQVDDYATDIFNRIYGYGTINRAEWLCLDDCFDVGRDAFMAKLLTDCPTLFGRTMSDDAPEEAADDVPVSTDMSASADDFTPQMGKESATIPITSDMIPLTEAGNGATIPIKIIQPGWGSSGYYPAEVLKRDGPNAFPAGTHMYMDHPTAQEEAARPERSLNDLAAVTTQAAHYDENGKAGPGLYAECKPFSDSAGRIREMGPHIGTSIRANGVAENGEMEGRKGPIIKQIVAGKSIDFVTQAGAGGKVLAEAARSNSAAPVTQSTEVTVEDRVLQERLNKLETENARLREGALLREAKEFVLSALPVTLPALTRVRLAESLARNPALKDGAIDVVAYKTAIAEAVKAETDYLAAVTGSGQVRGMGASSGGSDGATAEAALVESFKGLGYSEATAKLMAKGRE